jgi:hypothetical protein
MSCEICYIHQGAFKSEDQLIHIREKINELIAENMLEELEEVDFASPFLTLRYKCKRCEVIWVLTLPDQAFRGDMQTELQHNR